MENNSVVTRTITRNSSSELFLIREKLIYGIHKFAKQIGYDINTNISDSKDQKVLTINISKSNAKKAVSVNN